MDRELIIRLAREAGLIATKRYGPIENYERFAALVVANNPPQSWMSYQEGYEAGKLAEREHICKQIAMLHDSLSLTGTANWGKT